VLEEKQSEKRKGKPRTLHFLPSLTASLTETTVTEPNSKPPEPPFQKVTGGLSYRPILFQNFLFRI